MRNKRAVGKINRISQWLIAVVIAFGLAFPAAAQIATGGSETPQSAEIPQNLTREQVRDLVARLSDDEVRELVIRQLDKVALEQAQAEETMVYVGQLREGIRVAWQALQRMFSSGDRIHALPAIIWRQVTDDGRVSGWYLLFQLIGLIIAGLVGERLARGLLEKRASHPVKALQLGERFNLACLGMALGLVELGAFAGGAFLFIAITSQQSPAAQTLWHELVWCLVTIKVVLLAVRQVAAPRRPEARLVEISDHAARQAWGWTLILMASLLLPLPILRVAVEYGADAESELFLRVMLGGIFVLALILLTYRLRRYGAALIAEDAAEAGAIRQTLARIWWMLAIVYVLIIWLMSIGKRAATGESSLAPGLGSLLLFVLIPYFDMGLKWLIAHYFEPKPGKSGTGEGADSVTPAVADTITADTRPGYIATALRYARILMALAIVTIFARLWNIDVVAFAATLVGPRFAAALFDITITVLLAWALWGVIRISIERKLEVERGPAGDSDESEAGGVGGTRTATILPLIRASIKITLITMTVMICLSALGVNIGPLLAGAGVVGIAIGFGAQTLVRDIVSGFFYLLDDAFRIGEYVVIDQIRGTVEKISIRSFQLRHHEGPVHTIPYGEIRTLTNWSRDWAIMKFELRIPYETDIEKVRKLIKKIGLEMMEDPVYGPLMLAPLKSQGVNRMDDSALIIRCKFTALPGQQYLIRREAFTRIQKAFEENGIQFAPRRVLVEATTPQEAIQAAAGAIDQAEQPQGSDKRM